MANTVITVNPETGTTTNTSILEIVEGNHDHMPSRTDAYEPTDERGHNNASSLGGSNAKDNVFAQSKDLNHGSYLQMENGEKDVLRAHGSVHSEKTAFISSQPGGRPDAFMVNDHVTYANGNVQNVYFSFANLTNAEQENLNAALQEHSDMLNAPNPGDILREQMSPEEYSRTMEVTEAFLPGVRDNYDRNWISSTTAGAAAAPGTAASASTEGVAWSFDAADSIGTAASLDSAGTSWSFNAADVSSAMDTSEGVSAGDSFSDSGAGAESGGADAGGTDDGGTSYDCD